MMKNQPVHSMVLAGFALSILAGVLLIINAAVWFTMGGIIQTFVPFALPVLAFMVLGVIAIVFAIVLFLGAFLIYWFRKEALGGIIVLIAAIFSLGVGGGFVFGTLCGILAGMLTLLRR